jgi:predicted nuclease of predicted toxin-antitoxin system
VNLKLDENLPSALAARLRALGHDAQTVPSEGLAGHADPRVWRAARAEGRFLITQDLDFSDIRFFTPGSHPGILLVRLVAPGRKALLHRVMEIFENEPVDEWAGCLVVATEHKLRIRRASNRA